MRPHTQATRDGLRSLGYNTGLIVLPDGSAGGGYANARDRKLGLGNVICGVWGPWPRLGLRFCSSIPGSRLGLQLERIYKSPSIPRESHENQKPARASRVRNRLACLLDASENGAFE